MRHVYRDYLYNQMSKYCGKRRLIQCRKPPSDTRSCRRLQPYIIGSDMPRKSSRLVDIVVVLGIHSSRAFGGLIQGDPLLGEQKAVVWLHTTGRVKNGDFFGWASWVIRGLVGKVAPVACIPVKEIFGPPWEFGRARDHIVPRGPIGVSKKKNLGASLHTHFWGGRGQNQPRPLLVQGTRPPCGVQGAPMGDTGPLKTPGVWALHADQADRAPTDDAPKGDTTRPPQVNDSQRQASQQLEDRLAKSPRPQDSSPLSLG